MSSGDARAFVLISAYKNRIYITFKYVIFQYVIFSTKGFNSAEKMVLSLSHSADTTLFSTAQLGQRLTHITSSPVNIDRVKYTVVHTVV